MQIEFQKGATLSVTSQSFKKDLQQRSMNNSERPDISNIDDDCIPELPVPEEVENRKVITKGRFDPYDRIDS